MPRETIHGNGMPIDVEVAWSGAGEYVQVASVHTEGHKPAFVIINEWLQAAEMPTIDVEALRLKMESQPQTSGSFAVPHGWHATFENRRDINRMIAVLRRARDHAFGKDE